MGIRRCYKLLKEILEKLDFNGFSNLKKSVELELLSIESKLNRGFCI